MKTELKTMSVAQFVKAKLFVEVNCSVRVNTNGYPFVTFINADNVAENVYFSKNAGAKLKQGAIISLTMLADYCIAEVANAEGEIRTKLVSSVHNRIRLVDLL